MTKNALQIKNNTSQKSAINPPTLQIYGKHGKNQGGFVKLSMIHCLIVRVCFYLMIVVDSPFCRENSGGLDSFSIMRPLEHFP